MILLMHILGIGNMYFAITSASLVNLAVAVGCAYAIRVVKLVNKAKK